MHFARTSIFPLVAIGLAAATALPAKAEVRVLTGPTPIERGDARAAGDITVINERLAFSLAVQSSVPYGVPRCALVDLAPVTHGRVGRDRVVFADFIPNDWSAWPNSYQRLEILERGPEKVVARCVRDWGRVKISTTYTLRSGSDHVLLVTTMNNAGSARLEGLLSGFTLWPNSGFRFGVPGLDGLEHGAAVAALAPRTVAYDEHWMVALHAPYLTHIAHGSLDLYQQHSLEPGESRRFEGWLQVGARGDLAPVVAAEIRRQRLPSGTVQGAVKSEDEKPIEQPVVVVEKSGHPYAWAMGTHGHYALQLPAGEYTLYATARDYSQTLRSTLTVAAGSAQTLDFAGLRAPGAVHFDVRDQRNGQPLDARIAITAGQQPLVEFLGRKVFFTELEPRGQLDLRIAPGVYTFNVRAGGGFTTPSQRVSLRVEPGSGQTASLALTPAFEPAARGWYGADLHHHADQAEAVTPPADLARSQLAAGLDLLFVSDHDSLANLESLRQIAAHRGVPFIAGVELSPSWGHFNAYPITIGQHLSIDTSRASVDAVFAEARRLGASVVQVNHPLIPYGYFTSIAAGVAPGGFNPHFDLVEINATEMATDAAVYQRVWQFWNAGQHYYLSAGTDTHDVWNRESGSLRAYAHVEGALTTSGFVDALRAGHAYVSYGPLIYPDVMFGTTLNVAPDGDLTLGFDLESLAGLRRADLIGGGASVMQRTYDGSPQRARADFTLHGAHAGWYALIVEDIDGNKAYTDPIWIDSRPAAE